MITNFIEALRLGHMLRDPTSWKNRQLVINAIAAILGFIVALANLFGFPINLDAETTAAVGSVVWTIVSLFNGWATVATTEKIGLLPDNKR